MNINIPGIDVEKAIKNAGSEELFIELLGDVYKLMDDKVASVESNLASELPVPPESTAKLLFLDIKNVDWNMFCAKDILPAAAPLGSSPVGSVITMMLQVAATLLIVINNMTKNTRETFNLFNFIHPSYLHLIQPKKSLQ